MKNVMKLSVLLVLAGLISTSLGSLGDLLIELDFEYLSDGTTVATDGDAIATSSWDVTDVYDAAGTADPLYVAGNVPTYAAYDTTGLPSGMDGYAISTGGLWNNGATVGNTGNGFTSMARVNLLGVYSDWTVIIGRPGEYIVFLKPDGSLGLYIDGVGDTFDIMSAEELGTYTDTWIDVAFTFDGVGSDEDADTYSLYINGQLVYSDTQVTTVDNGDVEHIGATGGGGQVFGGLIDYYAYYDGAATAEEILALTVIPEPATMLLLGVGALAMLKKRK